MRRARSTRRKQVPGGIRLGLQFAAGFSVLAAAACVVGALKQGQWHDALWLWASATFFYAAAGSVGGALFGWLRPVQDRVWGRYLTAYLILVLVYGGGTLAFWPLLTDGKTDGPSRLFMLTAWAIIALFLAPVYVLMFKGASADA